MKMPTHLAPFDNGAYCARKLGFLYFIRRTSFVDPVRSLMNTLGGDPPMWSRVFKWTSEFVADKLGWKLEARGLSFFQPWFEMYSEAIRNKANEKGREIRGGGATDLFRTRATWYWSACSTATSPRPAPPEPGQPRPTRTLRAAQTLTLPSWPFLQGDSTPMASST